jgi:hAT family C-terminal dimerisation region
LKPLVQATHKQATEYLDRAAAKRYSKFQLPLAAGVIARLRIIVLWIARSPQRIQQWDKKAKKAVNYDVDNRWNSSLRMIRDAFDCRAALNDTCDENRELEKIKLQPEHWQRLEDIRTLLHPFWEYTEFVSREQPTLQLAARFYIQIQATLNSITRKKGKYAAFDDTLINAVKAGVETFEKYNSFMRDNDIYFIASVLDPRIKTQWIKDHMPDADNVIKRIRKFLKSTYPSEPSLLLNAENDEYKSLEYRFLEPYQSSAEDILETSDIDRYLDSPRVAYRGNPKEDQTEWILRWWNANQGEFKLMAQAARDYLPIPSSEVDIERLFNIGRDILGIRRFAMNGDTLRTLITLRNVLKMKEPVKKHTK